MIKQELITAVAERIDVAECDVKKILEGAIDVATETLNAGEEIVIRNFGSFQIKVRAPKSVRNINTGEQYMIGATRRVVFKPGRNIK